MTWEQVPSLACTGATCYNPCPPCPLSPLQTGAAPLLLRLMQPGMSTGCQEAAARGFGNLVRAKGFVGTDRAAEVVGWGCLACSTAAAVATWVRLGCCVSVWRDCR